jgi:hypothetical protein
MMDNNLDRLAKANKITEQQLNALQRYAAHWYLAGFAGTLNSCDLNRIKVAAAAAHSGLTGSERQVMYRMIYLEARGKLGYSYGAVADMVACYDHPLEIAGLAMGYASPYRARQAATAALVKAANGLSDFWSKFDKRAR